MTENNQLATIYLDMRGVPIAFDIATYFAVAVATLRKQGYHQFDIVLAAFKYREESERDKTYGKSTKDWRLINLVWRIASLVPGLQNIFLARSDRIYLADPRYPPEYLKSPAAFPYYSSDLVKAAESGADIHVFEASPYARDWAKNALHEPGAIVMTIRGNDFDANRDTPVDLWYRLYRYLTSKGRKVFIIPDQHDLLYTQKYKQYDWNALEAASMDLDLRLALHQEASANILWGGGAGSFAVYSTAPFLMFGVMNGRSGLSNGNYFAKAGLTIGVNPPYLLPNQIYDWTDAQALTEDYIISATEKYLAQIQSE